MVFEQSDKVRFKRLDNSPAMIVNRRFDPGSDGIGLTSWDCECMWFDKMGNLNYGKFKDKDLIGMPDDL